MNVYEELRAVNVNEHTEKKNNLTYLSWAWAWDEVMRRYPGAEYEIKEFDGKPYLYDRTLGYLVMTSMTIDGITRTMWLPVRGLLHFKHIIAPLIVLGPIVQVTLRHVRLVVVVAPKVVPVSVLLVELPCHIGVRGLGVPEPSSPCPLKAMQSA